MNRTQQIISVQPLRERRQRVISATRDRDGRVDSPDQFIRHALWVASVIETVNRRLANANRQLCKEHTKTTGKTHTHQCSPFLNRSIKSRIKLSSFSCWRQWQSGSYFTAALAQPALHMGQVQQSVALREVQARWVYLNGSSQEEPNAKQRVWRRSVEDGLTRKSRRCK